MHERFTMIIFGGRAGCWSANRGGDGGEWLSFCLYLRVLVALRTVRADSTGNEMNARALCDDASSSLPITANINCNPSPVCNQGNCFVIETANAQVHCAVYIYSASTGSSVSTMMYMAACNAVTYFSGAYGESKKVVAYIPFAVRLHLD